MKTGKKPSDSICRVLKVEMVLEDVGVGENGVRM
jgi:hypothetical protein